MIYTSRDKLTVIEQNDITDRISFETLSQVILEKPANMIYCVSKGELYGIISMGDIARARDEGFRYVMINKKFTWVMKNEYMKAREIFCHKKNINALPVVNDNNMLLGAYTRWDVMEVREYVCGGNIKWRHQHYNRVFLVYPCVAVKRIRILFETFRDYLISEGIQVNCIRHVEIKDFLKEVKWILFVDEEERRAMHTICSYIWDEDLKGKKFYTCKEFLEEYCYESEGILRNIKEKGVYIFHLVWEQNARNKRYSQELKERIAGKYSAIGKPVTGKLYDSMYQDFFDEMYSEEYANNILGIDYQVETQSGCGKLRDCHSKFYNVFDGERYTCEQPQEYSRTIYFVGACYAFGRYVEDNNTIESFLQKHINKAGYKVKVMNCSSPVYAANMDALFARILSLPLRKGDIVLYGYRDFLGVDKINMLDACWEHDVKAEWMVDHPMHCNHRLNSIYAETIYDMLIDVLQVETENQGMLIEDNGDFIKKLYIDRYFKDFNPSMYNKIGSIVMNCNPFTLGHRYLIEQALKKVDFLIVFVVEENSSLFSFNERFAMVCEGMSGLDNVMIVPSGAFILAKTTFPEYFIKEADEYLSENTENDIKIFAERIAPYLNISYRFVGEEPEDKVTNEYNKAMKKILPKRGIKLVEISRKEVDGQYISASFVRRCLEKYDLEGLRKLVPESTMRLLEVT